MCSDKMENQEYYGKLTMGEVGDIITSSSKKMGTKKYLEIIHGDNKKITIELDRENKMFLKQAILKDELVGKSVFFTSRSIKEKDGSVKFKLLVIA